VAEINKYPGKLVLFGSGETLPPSGKAHEFIARSLGARPRIVILETPAGFEPNSARVAQNVGDFMQKRLQNYKPLIDIVPARRDGTKFSPNNPEVLEPMLQANWIFMGPGSPTYAVRQLNQSVAYRYLRAKFRIGTSISLASAAVLSLSIKTLPVYEIYKVGEDLHWKSGLNFLGDYGLNVIFVPHWNNSDGGAELDTSRCYMGVERFNVLLDQLEENYPVIGIDENTALVIDVEHARAEVMGNGQVTLMVNGVENNFPTGSNFPIYELGDFNIPSVQNIVDEDLLSQLRSIEEKLRAPSPNSEIIDLVNQREEARKEKNWATADKIRDQLITAGWMVQDTQDGPAIIWVGG
jgi:cyanophycinase-like exopeptidase